MLTKQVLSFNAPTHPKSETNSMMIPMTMTKVAGEKKWSSKKNETSW